MENVLEKGKIFLVALIIFILSVFTLLVYQSNQSNLSSSPPPETHQSSWPPAEPKEWNDALQEAYRRGNVHFNVPALPNVSEINYHQKVVSQTIHCNRQPTGLRKVTDRYGNTLWFVWFKRPEFYNFTITSSIIIERKIDRSSLNPSDPFPVIPEKLPKEARFYIKGDYRNNSHFEVPDEIEANNSIIINLAKNLTKGCTTEIEAVNSIFHWITKNIKYPDRCRDAESRSTLVIKKKLAHCTGFSNLMVGLLRASGIPARQVGGLKYCPRLDSNGHIKEPVKTYSTHVWVEVYFPSIGWIQYDPALNSTVPSGITFQFLPDGNCMEGLGIICGGCDPHGWMVKSIIEGSGALENSTIKITYTVRCQNLS